MGKKASAKVEESPALYPAPEALIATMDDHDGEMGLAWDHVRGATSYTVQVCPDPMQESNWRPEGVAPRSTHTVKGLTPGTRH
jgi:hypothetical protein